jgi:hypothetical protein
MTLFRLNAILVAVLLIPSLAFGQSDTTPPTLVSFSIVPDTIDTRGGPQSVTVTIGATDAPAGALGFFVVLFRSPSGMQRFELITPQFPISGDSRDGVWQATGNFPQFTESGTWTVTSLYLQDLVGNFVTHTTSTLQALGLPVNLTVTSNPDTTPPQVVGLRITPSEIDVSAGAQDVTVEVDLTDALAGVIQVSCVLRSPSGSQAHSLGFLDFQLLSPGTAQSGTWQGTLRIPQFSESGTWTLTALALRDTASNFEAFSTSQLRTLGFSPDLVVRSDPSDTSAPELINFSFTPTVIDPPAGQTQVQVTYTVTDNLAGVDFGPDPEAGGAFNTVIVFGSPSGAQGVGGQGPVLIQGDALDGDWQHTLVFPNFGEEGTWTVRLVILRDAVRNIREYTTSDLRAAGFQTDLNVVRPSLVSDGTVNSGGGTVTDQTFGTTAQVTFPAGGLSTTTEVAIDVFDSPLSLPTPSGFSGPGTRFVNIDLTPEPSFPLPPPGLTIVLPLVDVMIPGATINLFRVDPSTGNLVPALDVSGQPVLGTVDPGGLSATFTGVAGLSIVVGLIPVTEPFAELAAELRIERREFNLRGGFTLGPNTDGIAPTTEDVRIQVGPYVTEIPAGRFSWNRRKMRFEFKGVISGVTLNITIRPFGAGRFEFSVKGEGVNFRGVSNPVTLNLVIGNDGGSVDVMAKLGKK